jgi:dCMP deaminase
VQNGTQVAAGYNGSPRKLEHCDDVDHMMVDGHCKRVVHAEVNAIVNAARNGASTMGATLYCNYMPCWDCFKTIINAGIAEVVYRNVYKSEDERVVESASTVGIGLRHIVKQE